MRKEGEGRRSQHLSLILDDGVPSGVRDAPMHTDVPITRHSKQSLSAAPAIESANRRAAPTAGETAAATRIAVVLRSHDRKLLRV